MLIGILQTGQMAESLRDSLGDYPDMFRALLAERGFEFRDYHVEAMEFPADVHDCDGWLITGSRHGAYEDHPFIAPLEEFIRRAYAEAVPMVGICFGHQIIAQALGGKVEKFPGGWSVGPQDYAFGDETIRLNAWHQDQVVARPEGACVVGSSDFCENAALIYGERAFTVQAHPEFSDAVVEGLMDRRGAGVVPDPLMAEARTRLGQPNSSQALAQRIANFFLQSRGGAAPAQR
ncbi:type 1 glutamine amidotransferase [Pseudothioclava arenosa]|uniref:Glutamine amidotransferase n=1 Tax=Pseudothioclava arenosa TaxID=1795308 RepID=A0A2A4CM56_9RHOB|nr:type 1 glutamine amidotransferase [Pseudothioclava arenosa]PCD77063.1 glutamine amidotransferase [Pseudothioclava arenosa]